MQTATTTQPKNNQGHSKSMFLLSIPILFIFILFLRFVILGSSDSDDSKENKKENSSSNVVQEVQRYSYDETVSMELKQEYGEFAPLSSGKLFGFAHASVDYVVIDGNGNEYYGKKGEDISPRIPNSHSNLKMRFRSQTNKSGTIDIVVYNPN